MNITEKVLPNITLARLSLQMFFRTLALTLLIYIVPCVLVISFCSSDLQKTYDMFNKKNKAAAFSYKELSRASKNLYMQVEDFARTLGPYDATFSWSRTIRRSVAEAKAIAKRSALPYEILIWQLVPKSIFYALIFALLANAALVFILMDIEGKTGFANRNFFELFSQFPMLLARVIFALIIFSAIILCACFLPFLVYASLDVKGLLAVLFFGIWTFAIISVLFFIITAVFFRQAAVYKRKWPREAFYYSAKIALNYPVKFATFFLLVIAIMFVLTTGNILLISFLRASALKFSFVFMTGALITGFLWIFKQMTLAMYFLNVEAKINPIQKFSGYYPNIEEPEKKSKNLRGKKMETLDIKYRYEVVELPVKIKGKKETPPAKKEEIKEEEAFDPQKIFEDSEKAYQQRVKEDETETAHEKQAPAPTPAKKSNGNAEETITLSEEDIPFSGDIPELVDHRVEQERQEKLKQKRQENKK